MFDALVITLREGVEAALVLGVASALLHRRGFGHLKWALALGTGLALAASVAVVALATRLTWNEELAEGIVMLVGAALVGSLVWWMWRAAPHMKQEIESGVARVTGAGGAGNALGLVLFAFGMVFREGVETAIFLSAASFNSEGLALWVGAGVGLLLAIAFGILFVRGSVRVPLKTFFALTTAVLLLLAVRLVIGGLHELSEAEVLPASRTEMAIIGPLVKNELLIFTLTLALAAGWLLFGSGASPAPAPTASGPQGRLERAARARVAGGRRALGMVGLLVVGVLTTAFALGSRVPDRPPAEVLPSADGAVTLNASAIGDGHLHFFEVALPERPIRFFAVQVGDQIHTCFDACEICGDIGYFEDAGAAVCRNCTSPIAMISLGRTGGCNPIPLPHRREADTLVIAESDLRAVLAHIEGK